MTWKLFHGDGRPRPGGIGPDGRPLPAWRALPDLPPWRGRAEGDGPPVFVALPGLDDAVNAALHLRRPLLINGSAGMGKSTLVGVLAHELQLGEVLEWHITSKSTVNDGLYRYDALDRLHAAQLADGNAPIGEFVRLGPLGTALADPGHPRAVLIDEIDKSDLDLPGDLLNVLESGRFDIPPLMRSKGGPFRVTGADGRTYDVGDGRVTRRHYPVIVLTSNNERTFAPPFLRRCIRFQIKNPDASLLTRIVQAHLPEIDGACRQDIERFAGRLQAGEKLAVNQLLEMVYLVTGHDLGAEERGRLEKILLDDLGER
ncbi:MoxR family ATPase [Actinomadura luteofluorescens]|uniref:MoxR-like ATPase n=1 Tax=Actinomadura luteofluorescens TaxID=46163 RepID=A0A7Y9EMK8_9ACTN|nr:MULTISPECIES: MoxR family ATPase [Actinomadura]MCR3742431.1 MoxR-like ATPase [Actinomadura glauciflava]NYD50416.1 MoxR-like ATPase [Actinomadura luteofluorescens]